MTTNQVNASAQLNKPVLKEGSKGNAVKELQKLLLQWGAFVSLDKNGACVFPGEEVIDGIFGSQTKDAVILYQGQKFLQQDGIVADKTWRSLYLNAPVDMPILKKGSKGGLVKKVQERLAIGDYYNGTLDGDFGNNTEKAIKDLQKRTGLPVDGIIGDRTWFELSQINTVFC
ncbi:peptidoglycan-binding protein [Brasilonema sp. UFV-L1]|uniref:peptidoglycan-binding domain-containing protein n=1 Tax=Brasilonema sp. UFV-L1 TaxID=2234130 RepID=UPI00145F1B49|nr:peptidoglycan-binding protein [Brasilonema sp. UFV-L1]NMG09204.1 peptidoglycan-binding protein [Brasilonema sp. UFV-L1]